MKYAVVWYSPPLMRNTEKVAVGAIVTDGNKLAYRFNCSASKERELESKFSSFDRDVFRSFERNFTLNFVDRAAVTSSTKSGNKRRIKTSSDDFLDFLWQNYQGSYFYSKPQSIEGSNAQEALDHIAPSIL